jgi:outer membrane biosynthesis protein TonB
MIPNTQPRKTKNSQKTNLVISFVFHAVLVLVLVYFAAREGLLGKKMEKIAVTMVKEKPPEKPKEPPKVEPPKIVTPKVEPPKIVETPKAAPPPSSAPPTVAPPATILPSLDFGGGHEVVDGDPVQVYKAFMEYTLRTAWNKPDGMDDDNYVVEMGVTVDKDGQLGPPVLQKSSGNEQWDDSVKQVFAVVKALNRLPPTNFPPTVTIRFDVQLEDMENILQ